MSESVEVLLGLAPLEVGSRVRVRLSGEEFWLPRTSEFDGLVGTVDCVYPGVTYPYVVDVAGHGDWNFARAELERLP